MKKRNVRVVVASEYPEVRYLLKEMVEHEGGVTVGQAQDAPKALTMVRNVKPDIAIIDCYLPYVTSLHTLPLSRIGGLDIAQRINQEAPGTEVVLLNNLDTAISDRAVISRDGMTYSMRDIESNMPLLIRNLRQTETHPNNLVFANVEAEPEEILKPNATNPFDIVIFSGACGIAVGWFLIVCMISFTVGGIIALAGITTVVLGMAGKFTASIWSRLFRRKPQE